MINYDVKIKCRVCGNTSKAENFVLSHIHKMMVCPTCNAKERKMNINNLEKPFIVKNETIPKKVETAPISKKVKARCKKCGYIFSYDTIKKTPNLCPYCNNPNA